MIKEVKLGPISRAASGRFSSIEDAFRAGAESTLRKFALLNHTSDPGTFLAQLFSRSNFGYGKDPQPPTPPATSTSYRANFRFPAPALPATYR